MQLLIALALISFILATLGFFLLEILFIVWQYTLLKQTRQFSQYTSQYTAMAPPLHRDESSETSDSNSPKFDPDDPDWWKQ